VGSACSRTIGIDLTVVEPCTQKDRALNGVSSYVVSTTGAEEDTRVAFNVDQGPAPLAVSLGERVIVTLQAFADDVSADPEDAGAPQAIGRTPPLALTDATPDVSHLLVTGEVESFGRTTDAEGACTAMAQDNAVPGRHAHTATFVPGLNKVLIYGGAVWVQSGGTVEERPLTPPTAELWDPATGTFEALGADVGVDARAYHAATALPDGRVLITGGFAVVDNNLQTLVTAKVFDPELGDFTTFSMRQARAHHTSTLLEEAGVVAIVGGCVGTRVADGCTFGSAAGTSTQLPVGIELFDVAEGTATVAAGAELAAPRAFHQATSLGGPNPILVVTGGADGAGTIAAVELFKVEGGALVAASVPGLQPFADDRAPVRHAAVALDPQRLLVIGGQTQAPSGVPGGPGTPDVFFLSTTSGVDVGHPFALFQGQGRFGHQAAKLQNGAVVVVGGALVGADAPAAELLAPDPASGALTTKQLKGLPNGESRDHAALAILPNNQLLLTGGHSTPEDGVNVTSTAADIFFGR
jgi:hypothetical protein